MSIEQKAREIEQTASFMPYNGRRGIGYEAARLGIIEGLEMALSCSQEVIDDMRINGDEIDLRTVKHRVASVIRALVEGQKV